MQPKKQNKTDVTDYTIEREFLGGVNAAELLSQIIKAHLSDFSCQETETI